MSQSTDQRFAKSRLLWKPISPTSTNVEAFRRAVNRAHPTLNLRDYYDLYTYSVSDYNFWMDLWKYFGIMYSSAPIKVIADGHSAEHPQWFPGAMLNYAENILCRNDDSIACITIGEPGGPQIPEHVSTKALRGMVSDMAAALRSNGLQTGDRVAAIVSNSTLAIVIALATASIGAIYTSSAPDMGAKGILDRYRQVRPRFLFAETETFYGGKFTNITSKIMDIIQGLASHELAFAVLLPTAREHDNMSASVDTITPKADKPTVLKLSNFLSSGDGQPLTFRQLPFQHPLFILYSSGTTGAPKCIVHSAGGILLQTMKDSAFCYEVGATDTLLQYTTTGWMMWNFMLAAIPLGGRLLLYNGSPMHPSIQAFLQLVHEHRVSILGVSPRFLTEMKARNIHPSTIGTFDALRAVVSGGAVLTAPVHEWTQLAFGAKIRVMTGMGSTDVCTAFLSGAACLPVYAGEISCKSLGMKVEVFDHSGKNIEGTAEPGEMVCTRAHPSIPLYFWDDPSGQRFHETYFSMFPGIWRQGDFMVVNPSTNGVLILGRSDGVLNPSGIRFGSGEIYSIMETFSPIVEDSICVGQQRTQDANERVLLFVKMQRGKQLTKSLVNRIKHAIRNGLSHRHVPSYILEVKAIPYTINGKKIEIAVKQIVSGMDVIPSGAVANPEALREYYQYQALESIHDAKL